MKSELTKKIVKAEEILRLQLLQYYFDRTQRPIAREYQSLWEQWARVREAGVKRGIYKNFIPFPYEPINEETN